MLNKKNSIKTKYIHFSLIFILSITFIISCSSNKTCLVNFDTFIERFKIDSTFQKQHIEYPLIEYYSDEDFPLDILERGMSDENNYTFVDINNDVTKELNNKNKYNIHIGQNADTIYYQKIGKDNSINITYSFICYGKSYKLFKIEDYTD